MLIGDLSGDLEPGLLGVEIGRSKIRLALLDSRGGRIIDVAERPIAKAGGPRDPIEQENSTLAALVAALDRVGYTSDTSLVAGVSIGFANCGVGSGPALRGWLQSLSDELGEPVVLAGETGISYAPSRCVDLVRRVFKQAGVPLARVELAPVASARVLRPLRSGALTLGSGIAWSARLLDSQVLEAFEVADDPFDDVLRVIVGGVAEPLASLEGVDVDEQLCRNRGIVLAALMPAVGAAVSLLSQEQSNLLDGEVVGDSASVVEPRRATASVAATVPSTSGRSRAVDFSDQLAEPDELSDLLADTDIDSAAREDIAWAEEIRDDDTRQLKRQRGQDDRLFDADPAGSWNRGGSRLDANDDLAGIEAFAHPGDEPASTFDLSDFLLGALGMSAIVLLVLLVLS